MILLLKNQPIVVQCIFSSFRNFISWMWTLGATRIDKDVHFSSYRRLFLNDISTTWQVFSSSLNELLLSEHLLFQTPPSLCLLSCISMWKRRSVFEVTGDDDEWSWLQVSLDFATAAAAVLFLCAAECPSCSEDTKFVTFPKHVFFATHSHTVHRFTCNLLVYLQNSVL